MQLSRKYSFVTLLATVFSYFHSECFVCELLLLLGCCQFELQITLISVG